MTNNQKLTDAGLFWADYFPVFLCQKNKKPTTTHAFKDASQDYDTVVVMFSQPGAALIAVPTGAASNLFCIDVDVKNGKDGKAWHKANRELFLPACG